MNMLPVDLCEFEKDIAKEYEDGKIRAPVHLRDGNEVELYKFFEENQIGKKDYVFCTWASHLHALLKGVKPKKVREAIMEGRSITLHFPKQNFYSSAIVGGVAPIAVGTAEALKRKNDSTEQFVYCFIGDMALTTGVVSESIRYSIGNDLPIHWVVENNKKSVCTPTNASWGMDDGDNNLVKDVYRDFREMVQNYCNVTEISYYEFECSYPHSGCGVFVQF